jgi:hypothetical protein
MTERHLSARVDPGIFQHLQEKIDEEGKVRDVLRLDSTPLIVMVLTHS